MFEMFVWDCRMRWIYSRTVYPDLSNACVGAVSEHSAPHRWDAVRRRCASGARALDLDLRRRTGSGSVFWSGSESGRRALFACSTTSATGVDFDLWGVGVGRCRGWRGGCSRRAHSFRWDDTRRLLPLTRSASPAALRSRCARNSHASYTLCACLVVLHQYFYT